MRTTLTLDDDVAAQLEALRRKQHATLKHVVNQALRIGLRELRGVGKATRKRYRMEPFGPGEPKLANYDNIAEVLAFAEGDDFK